MTKKELKRCFLKGTIQKRACGVSRREGRRPGLCRRVVFLDKQFLAREQALFRDVIVKSLSPEGAKHKNSKKKKILL